jgi:hypothetical protein
LDGTLQERGPCWLGGLFEGHGAHSAGACRALHVEAELDILASPGTMLAHVLSTDREQQQQQHILTLASAKATPAQHHVHHCSICGAARHTQTCLHTRTHVHVHTRTHACAHTCTHVCARAHNTNTNTRVYTHRRAHTHTHARAQTHRHTHARTHIHTCTCTHTLTRTHAYACTRCAMSFANFSASLATLPHLS